MGQLTLTNCLKELERDSVGDLCVGCSEDTHQKMYENIKNSQRMRKISENVNTKM